MPPLFFPSEKGGGDAESIEGAWRRSVACGQSSGASGAFALRCSVAFGDYAQVRFADPNPNPKRRTSAGCGNCSSAHCAYRGRASLGP